MMKKKAFSPRKELADGETCPKCKSKDIQPFAKAPIAGFDRICRGCGTTWLFIDRLVDFDNSVGVQHPRKLKSLEINVIRGRVGRKLHYGPQHLTKSFAEFVAGFIVRPELVSDKT